MPKTYPPEDIVTADQATKLVAELVKAHGTVAVAAKRWKCSVQMVHMVVRGTRRPTPGMLKELKLKPFPETARYLRVK